MKHRIVTHKELKTGDIVQIYDSKGLGLAGRMAEILPKHFFAEEYKIKGRVKYCSKTILIKLDNREIYRVSEETLFKQLITIKKNNEMESSAIIIKDNNTKVCIGGKIGECKYNGEYEYVREHGILIATARALGYDRKFCESLIDIIFEEGKTLNRFSSKELLAELENRIGK